MFFRSVLTILVPGVLLLCIVFLLLFLTFRKKSLLGIGSLFCLLWCVCYFAFGLCYCNFETGILLKIESPWNGHSDSFYGLYLGDRVVEYDGDSYKVVPCPIGEDAVTGSRVLVLYRHNRSKSPLYSLRVSENWSLRLPYDHVIAWWSFGRVSEPKFSELVDVLRDCFFDAYKYGEFVLTAYD